MLTEKNFEDIICKYPELIEDGLTLKGRQVTLYSRRMDILFEDKFKQKLIIELKAGPIKDAHIGQILSYEGMLLSGDNPTIRVMLVGTRVPPNIQRSLDHHGIAWKAISLSEIKEFLISKKDKELLGFFEGEVADSSLKRKSFLAEDVCRLGLKDKKLRGIILSNGGIKNNYIRIGSIIDFFPKDSIGGKDKAVRGREFLIKSSDGVSFYTDIDGEKKIFRARGKIGNFLKRNQLKEGDTIYIAKLSDYEYYLSKNL